MAGIPTYAGCVCFANAGIRRACTQLRRTNNVFYDTFHFRRTLAQIVGQRSSLPGLLVLHLASILPPLQLLDITCTLPSRVTAQWTSMNLSQACDRIDYLLASGDRPRPRMRCKILPRQRASSPQNRDQKSSAQKQSTKAGKSSGANSHFHIVRSQPTYRSRARDP